MSKPNTLRKIKTAEELFLLQERKIRKLKLERLMWKADSKAWYYTDLGFYDMASKWHKLYEACKKELEK